MTENSFKDIEKRRKYWEEHPEEALEARAKILGSDDFQPVAITPEEYEKLKKSEIM